MSNHLLRVLKDQRGATAVEYGLIISLLVIAMIVGLGEFADATIGMWNGISEEVSSNS